MHSYCPVVFGKFEPLWLQVFSSTFSNATVVNQCGLWIIVTSAPAFKTIFLRKFIKWQTPKRKCVLDDDLKKKNKNWHSSPPPQPFSNIAVSEKGISDFWGKYWSHLERFQCSLVWVSSIWVKGFHIWQTIVLFCNIRDGAFCCLHDRSNYPNN